MALLLASSVLAVGTGCMPFAVPPAVGEIGGTVSTAHEPREKLVVGAHLASAWHEDLPVDVGVGYVREGFSGGGRDVDAEPTRPQSTIARPPAARVVPQGVYFEAMPRIARGDHWRAFVGSRIEAYAATQTELVGMAMLARARVELVQPVETLPVMSASRKRVLFGIAHGMAGFGAYAEGGYQRWPTGEGGLVVGVGLSVRLPGVAGVVCCAPLGKKKRRR